MKARKMSMDNPSPNDMSQPQFPLVFGGGTSPSASAVNMSLVKAAFPTFKEHLMILWKTEICHEVLLESGVGRTLKFFHDYCLAYEEDMPELKTLTSLSEKILQKWKNFVLNTIFDDKRDNAAEFIKYKRSAAALDSLESKKLP
jgi:hypothetical protein